MAMAQVVVPNVAIDASPLRGLMGYPQHLTGVKMATLAAAENRCIVVGITSKADQPLVYFCGE